MLSLSLIFGSLAVVYLGIIFFVGVCVCVCFMEPPESESW